MRKTKSNPELAKLCEKLHKLTWMNEEGLRVMSFDQVRELLMTELGGMESYDVYQLSIQTRRRTSLSQFNNAPKRETLPKVQTKKQKQLAASVLQIGGIH